MINSIISIYVHANLCVYLHACCGSVTIAFSELAMLLLFIQSYYAILFTYCLVMTLVTDLAM